MLLKGQVEVQTIKLNVINYISVEIICYNNLAVWEIASLQKNKMIFFCFFPTTLDVLYIFQTENVFVENIFQHKHIEIYL